MIQRNVLVSALLATGVAATAVADVTGGYYLGAEVAREHQVFRPHYDFAAGGTSADYLDKSDDGSIALRAGYGWRLSERVGLAAQLRLAHAGNDWALNTGEPAALSFRIPTSLAVGAVAHVEVLPRWYLKTEFALGKGQVHETKSAPTASNYGFNEWVTHTAWAVGAGHALSDRWSIDAEYRHARYDSFVHTSARPGSSAVVETIRDAPTVRDYALTLNYRF